MPTLNYVVMLLCGLAYGRAQDSESVVDDRSQDLRMRWVVDESTELPSRDDLIFLEIENGSARTIVLCSPSAAWLKFVASAPEQRPRQISRGPLGWSFHPIPVPPGGRVHVMVPKPPKDTPDSLVGDLSLTAFLRIKPDDFVTYRLAPPDGRPGPRDPIIERAGYKAEVTSPPLRVRWERREWIAPPPKLPDGWASWRQAMGRFSSYQNEELRRLAAGEAGLPLDSSAATLSGLYEAEREWTEVLGAGSTIHEADDLAFALASSVDLDRGAHEERRRYLRWIMATHPGTTGARRAEILLEWLDSPDGPGTYLYWGRGVVPY